jgi:hypothetical protein
MVEMKMQKGGDLLPKIERIVRPGRRVGNVFQDKLPAEDLDKTLREAKVYPDVIVDRLERIFQPERKIQEVVVPYFPEFFKLICNDKPVIYKEFVVGADLFAAVDYFFSWVKRSRMKGIIVIPYTSYVVNSAEQPPVKIFSSRAAEEAAKFLKDEGGRCNRYYFRWREILQDELRACVECKSLFPREEESLVRFTETLWDGDLIGEGKMTYIECLQKAIKFCGGNPTEGERLEIKLYVKDDRISMDYNKEEYKKWYTVLALADALYVNQNYGVNIKLTKISDSNLDVVIRKFMKKLRIPFGFVWYNDEIEKELGTERRLSFLDYYKIDDIKTHTAS